MTMLRRLTKTLREGLPSGAAAWSCVALVAVLLAVMVTPVVMAQTTTPATTTPQAYIPKSSVVPSDPMGANSIPTTNMNFPVLGINSGQVTAIVTAFTVQWALFSGLNGSTGSALYYLALTFALVGLMLVVITPKNRSPGVLIPWFIILLVMIFAPYNSRLLFWPVVAPTTGQASGTCQAISGQLTSSNVNSVCGFTPQVVAVHLGSTLGLIVSDIMTSRGMKDAIAMANAQSALQNNPAMHANPDTANEIKIHDQGACAGTPIQPKMITQGTSPCTSVSNGSASGGAAPTSTSTDPTTSIAPQSVSSLLDEIVNQRAASGTNGERDLNIPAIVLPKNYKEAQQLGYNDDDWDAYIKGLKAYGTSLSDTATVNAQTTNTTDKSSADLSGLINTVIMPAVNAGAADGAGGMGFYLTTVGDDSQLKTIRGKAIGSTGNIDQVADAAKKGCQKDNDGAIWDNPAAGITHSVGWLFGRNFLNDCDATSKQAVAGTATFKKQVMAGMDGDGSNRATSLKNFQKIMGAVPGMMLARGSVVNDPSNASGGLTTTTSGEDCATRSENDFKNILTKQLGSFTQTDAGKQIVSAMMTCGTIDQSTLTSISTANSSNTNQGSKQFITDLINAAVASGGTLDGQGAATQLMQAWKATANEGQAGLPDRKDQNRITTTTPSSLKANLGYDVSDLVAKLGIGLAGGFGQIVGITAQAALIIMQYLIDLMLMFMIVATPLMFLMGLLIPTNAAGMLALTCMGMLILTMVPMTVTIINFLISAVQGMSMAVLGSQSWPAWFWNGIIKFTAAELYFNVIGLTMFIMFKLGDPSNIRGLTQIERGAKEMANAGKDAAIAMGTIAATVATGTAMGGMGGAGRALMNSLPINSKLRAAAMERRTGGEEDGPDDGAQKKQEPTSDKIADDIIKGNIDNAEKDPLGALQPGGIDGLGNIGAGIDGFSQPKGMDLYDAPIGPGTAAQWGGTLGGQTEYGDMGLQDAIGRDPSMGGDYGALSKTWQASEGGTKPVQFGANGEYTMKQGQTLADGTTPPRIEWTDPAQKGNYQRPGTGGGTGPTGPGAPSGSGPQFTQQAGVSAAMAGGGVGAATAGMGTVTPPAGSGGVVQVAGAVAVTNVEALMGGAAQTGPNTSQSAAKDTQAAQDARMKQHMLTARQQMQQSTAMDTGVRPGSAAPSTAGGAAGRVVQQAQQEQQNPRGNRNQQKEELSRTIRIDSEGNGVLVGGGKDGKDIKLTKDFLQNVSRNVVDSGDKVQSDGKGGGTITLKGNQATAVTNAAQDIQLNSTVGSKIKSSNFQNMGEFLGSIERNHDRLYDELTSQADTMKKRMTFRGKEYGPSKTRIREYKEGESINTGWFKYQKVPKGGLKVEEFNGYGLGQSMMKEVGKGMLGGFMGSIGGIGAGAGGLPFVKQALTVMKEAANEFSQGTARMDMIGQTKGGWIGSKLVNYGFANQRMAHDQWLRNGYARVGAANAMATNNGMDQQLKATLSDAFNSRRAADASLVEGYLARLQNKNAKDGVFSLADHRAAQRIDAISKVENFDKQVVMINSKVDVGDRKIRLSPKVLQELMGAKALNTVAKNAEEMLQTAAKHEVGGQSRVRKLTDAGKMAKLGRKAYGEELKRLDLGDREMLAAAINFTVADDYHKNAELAAHAGKLKGKIQDAQHRLMMEQIAKQTGQTSVDINVVPNFIYDQQAGRAVKKMIRKEISHEWTKDDAIQQIVDEQG